VEQISENAQIAEIKFTPSAPGFVSCIATNIHGSKEGIGQLMLSDLPQPFVLSGTEENYKIFEGDQLKLECRVATYFYSSGIKWYKNGEPIENSSHLTVAETTTKYSYRRSIKWENITEYDEGLYECKVHHKNDNVAEKKQIDIKVNTQSPVITSNFNQSLLQKTLGETLRLECLVSGSPVPNLVWTKENEIFIVAEKSSNRIIMDNNNMTIDFIALTMNDAGTYKCESRNRIGSDQNSVKIEVLGE